MSEREYIEQLYFCEKHKLICFEFYRRNIDWERKKAEQAKNVAEEWRKCRQGQM